MNPKSNSNPINSLIIGMRALFIAKIRDSLYIKKEVKWLRLTHLPEYKDDLRSRRSIATSDVSTTMTCVPAKFRLIISLSRFCQTMSLLNQHDKKNQENIEEKVGKRDKTYQTLCTTYDRSPTPVGQVGPSSFR
jgi:hypothetical protein